VQKNCTHKTASKHVNENTQVLELLLRYDDVLFCGYLGLKIPSEYENNDETLRGSPFLRQLVQRLAVV